MLIPTCRQSKLPEKEQIPRRTKKKTLSSSLIFKNGRFLGHGSLIPKMLRSQS